MTPGQAAFQRYQQLRGIAGGFKWDTPIRREERQALWNEIAGAAIERARLNSCPLCNDTCEHTICPHNNVVI